MRWKKTDVKKKANIIKEKIKNTDLTNEEIAKKTNTSRSVVSRVLNEELGEVGQKSDYIAKIIDNDKEIMDLANEIALNEMRKIQKSQKSWKWLSLYEVKTVTDIAEKSFKRYTLLKWNVTDSEGGLKSLEDFKNLSDDELLGML